MPIKLFFLSYLQADYGELEFYGKSETRKYFVSLTSPTEDEAMKEAKRIYSKKDKEAKKHWLILLRKRARAEKKAKALAEKTLGNNTVKSNKRTIQVETIKPVLPLRDWRPCCPELVSKLPIEGF